MVPHDTPPVNCRVTLPSDGVYDPRGQLHLDLLERPTSFISVQTGFGRCCQRMEHCGARFLAAQRDFVYDSKLVLLHAPPWRTVKARPSATLGFVKAVSVCSAGL